MPKSSSRRSGAGRFAPTIRRRSASTTTSSTRATSFTRENPRATMPHDRSELDTPRLTLLAYPPEQLLALIEQPERFEESFALTPADGLRGFYVSGEVSPQWLDSLRRAAGQGPNPWGHGFFVVGKASGGIVGGGGVKGV